MFKKGRKREARGLAVVYFFIGLIILLIILAVIYFALVELDYSDRIRNPEATIRSYVEMTPEPGLTLVGADDGFVDLTQVTLEPTAIPTQAPTPTPSPTPTPTPVPTPSPTPIPQAMVSQSKNSGFTLPNAVTENVVAGITKSYVSQVDNNRFMYLAGYAYIDDARFDGKNVTSFLIVSEGVSGQKIAYQMTMKDSASGVAHTDAKCKNASACDFECVIDVAQNYKEGVYNLGIVMGYKAPNKRKATWSYYALPTDLTFTVMAGQVVTPVSVPGAAVPGAAVPGAAVPAAAAVPATAAAPETASEADLFSAEEEAPAASDAFMASANTDVFEDAETAFEDDNFLLDPADTSFAGTAPSNLADAGVSIEDQIAAEQMVVG